MLDRIERCLPPPLEGEVDSSSNSSDFRDYILIIRVYFRILG